MYVIQARQNIILVFVGSTLFKPIISSLLEFMALVVLESSSHLKLKIFHIDILCVYFSVVSHPDKFIRDPIIKVQTKPT